MFDRMRNRTKVPRWEIISLAIFLALLILPAWRQFSNARRPVAPDPVTQISGRLECIKKALPARGAVGFAYGLNQTCPHDECGRVYFETAYNLAPLIVKSGFDYDWVVVAMDGATTVDQIERAKGLALSKRCGDGLLLFQRAK
jgi:hypothetical protein